MSILNKISKLIKLSNKIDILSQKPTNLTPETLEALNKDYQLILKSLDYRQNHKKSTFGVLSPHVHHVNLSDELNIKTRHKTDITFQFPKELNAVLDENEDPMWMATPPQSPVKGGTGFKSVSSSPVKSATPVKLAPPSPSKLKSPTKLPSKPLFLESLNLDLVKSSEALVEKHLHEARTIEYLDKVVALGKTVKSLISELQDEVKANKSKMIGSFKTLMEQNSLPFVKEHATQLLGELFDIVHRDGGTFAKLAKKLSEGFAAKLHAQNYPFVLGQLKKHVEVLLTIPSTESSVNIQKTFKKIIETELKLPYNEGFFDLFKVEYSEFLHDKDLSFHADKFVKLFSDRLVALNILDVRNKVVQQNPILFNALGKVDAKPENYFELTKESKQLGQHFIQSLYNSPERVEVLLHFQNIKEKNIKNDMINNILALRTEIYNQDLIYVENDQQKHYIQSTDDCEDLASLKLISWDEVSQNIKSIFTNRNAHLVDELNEQQIEKLLSFCKKSYDKVVRLFASIPAASEQNTCISFFPIQFESLPSGKLQHICLVTTSGAINKVENKKNKKALHLFQEMVKSFSQQSKPLLIDDASYTFVYHDEEKGAIDVLLQQINKGLSGSKAPLSSIEPQSELVLSDPFRGCAEKKFIDFVRHQLINSFDSKKMTILGAANLRMPIVPKREHSAILNESLVRLYKTCLSFYTKNEQGQVQLNEDKASELKIAFAQIVENDHTCLSKNSVKLSKSYYVVQDKLNLWLKKLPAKMAAQKLYDECLGNLQYLTMSQEQKTDIKNKETAHYGNMTTFYAEILNFLNARKLNLSDKKSEELLQQDINKLTLFIEEWSMKAKQNIEFLKKASMENKMPDSFNKALESAIKLIKTGLQLIDKPGKAFYSTDKMIETYTKLLKDAQQIEQNQIICASIIPISAIYNEEDSVVLETNYIDCCCACTANKLPVLTWLTDLQVAKQEKIASFECEPCLDLSTYTMPVKKVLFSCQSFNSPIASINTFNNSTGLSPLVRSLELSDSDEDLQQSLTGLPSSEQDSKKTPTARKLFS